MINRKNVKYSVVIPSYNPDDIFFKTLNSVISQTIKDPYEVIVVDSSSWDIKQKFGKQFPRVQFVWLKERTLSGRARSHGARLAKGEIVFFTDTDCIVNPDWMELHIEQHQKGYKVVGGGVANGTPDSLWGTVEYLVSFNEMNPYARAREIKAHPSCNLSVNRTIFDKVGYFPDFLKGEDTIFCDHIISAGEKIYFEPKALITHKNRTKFNQYIRNQISLGEGSNETRRRTQRHGYFLIQHPYLIGLIPLVRTYLISKRFVFSNAKLFFQFILYYPLILLGLCAYVWGFIRGPHRSGLSTESKS